MTSRPREEAVSVRIVRLALVVGLAVGALTACTGKGAVANGPQSGDQGYVGGQGTVQVVAQDQRVPAPPIQGQSLDGGVINLRDFSGDVVVLNFWASWCGPCRTEQAKLNTVYDAMHSKGVQFLGIDIRDDDASARAFLRTHNVRYSSIVDEPTSIPLEFDPRLPGTPPTTVIIDRSGRVAAKILGPAAKGVLQPLAEQFAAETS
jgi:peroxiredoxin